MCKRKPFSYYRMLYIVSTYNIHTKTQNFPTLHYSFSHWYDPQEKNEKKYVQIVHAKIGEKLTLRFTKLQ